MKKVFFIMLGLCLAITVGCSPEETTIEPTSETPSEFVGKLVSYSVTDSDGIVIADHSTKDFSKSGPRTVCRGDGYIVWYDANERLHVESHWFDDNGRYQTFTMVVEESKEQLYIDNLCGGKSFTTTGSSKAFQAKDGCYENICGDVRRDGWVLYRNTCTGQTYYQTVVNHQIFTMAVDDVMAANIEASHCG